jgi:hypothetical protein
VQVFYGNCHSTYIYQQKKKKKKSLPKTKNNVEPYCVLCGENFGYSFKVGGIDELPPDKVTVSPTGQTKNSFESKLFESYVQLITIRSLKSNSLILYPF